MNCPNCGQLNHLPSQPPRWLPDKTKRTYKCANCGHVYNTTELHDDALSDLTDRASRTVIERARAAIWKLAAQEG